MPWYFVNSGTLRRVVSEASPSTRCIRPSENDIESELEEEYGLNTSHQRGAEYLPGSNRCTFSRHRYGFLNFTRSQDSPNSF